jgi:two-component system LytT family sensor kinase
MVPSLILQPFVENAIKHGLSHSLTPVRLEIGARRDGGRLKLWVADDGTGSVSPCPSGLGCSLTNAGRRLHLLYGPEASLSYGPCVEGGWRVDVELPFEVAA